MKLFKRLVRIRKILAVSRRYRLIEFLPKSYRFWKLFLFIVAPFSSPCSKNISEGERLKLALTILGPIFIKFGQLLSTRRDLLPKEIADALAALQDKVEPFSSDKAISIAENALGDSIDNIFTDFESTPLASASVAQVHTAQLKTGEQVIVKILRPNIEQIIMSDLDVMAGFAIWLEKNLKTSHRFKPQELVIDYQTTILNELDLRLESANTAKLRRLWKDSDLLYVPNIFSEYCHKEVLVMERIFGVPISDVETLTKAGTDMKVLAERGVEIFFAQVFRDSYFHADMHPGNIFVDISDPKLPRYIAVDFGIMGSLRADDQRYLAENFLAFFNRDYQMVAKLHIESGWIPAGTSEAEFEAAIQSVCEPIFGKPLSEISFGDFLVNLFHTARQFNMQVQPQLVLLQKTLLYVEGLGRQLYPELDLWQTAKPYLENWLKDRMSPATLLEEIKRRAPFWREKLPEIPDLIYRSLKTDASKQLLLEKQLETLNQQLISQRLAHQRILYAIIGGSCLIAGILLQQNSTDLINTKTMLSIVGTGFLLTALLKSTSN